MMKFNLLLQLLIYIISLNVLISQQHSNLSNEELHKLVNELSQNSIAQQNNLTSNTGSKLFKEKNILLDSLNVNDLHQIQRSNYDELKYFGYDLFLNNQIRTIFDNQPPPSEYILGPGDEIIIEIWGDAQLRETYIINQYGKIYVDKIGQIYASGININDLENKLLKKFQNVYSSLKKSQSTAFLDISIGKLKSINVTILGESDMPGIYAIHPFSTIFTALLQTGGVVKTGSLRDIQLIRGNQVLSSFDLYKYLLNGNIENDQRLLDGDVIYIPIRNSTISIEGEIFREGKYELINGESIDDLLNYSGGLKVTALSKIHISRINNIFQQDKFEPPNESILINYKTNNDYILQDGDQIHIYKIAKVINKIYIYGQVKNPGEYSFFTNDKMKILDIMEIAGGVNDTTFMKTVYIKEGEIIRNNPNTNFPLVIKFNIQSLLNGDPTANLLLENWDIILIRENPNFKIPGKVIINGEVNVPGVYTLQKRWEGLDDILNRAGGFTEKAHINGLNLYRKNMQIAISDYNINLMDGDSIFVPQPPGIINVIGAVNRPGLVQYERKKSVNDYLESAGGYTLNSDRKNIIIISPNGDVKRFKKLKRIRLIDGSTIIVHEKKMEKPFDITEYASNLASILSSFATIYLLINK